jgi:hypothetical protein
MRKIILMMPVSAGGFIEGPEREFGWRKADELHRRTACVARAEGPCAPTSSPSKAPATGSADAASTASPASKPRTRQTRTTTVASFSTATSAPHSNVADMPGRHVALHLDLAPDMLGDALLAPAPNPRQI